MTSKRQAERRRQILRAAERVFDRHGYAGATVEQVAVEAGLAKGSIYNYFKSKEDLFKAIFLEVVSEAHAQVDKRLAGTLPAGRKIEMLLDYWFSALAHHNRIGRLVLEFWAAAARQGRTGQLPAIFRNVYAQSREKIANVIAEGIASGQFRAGMNTPVAASLIMAILDGIEIQSILEMGIEVNEQFLASLKRAVLAGLANPPAPRNGEVQK